MDRREALKKLAVGGGAVLGASTIVSSQVFAFAVPAIPDPTVTMFDTGNGMFTVTQEAAGTCSQSASSTTFTVALTGDGGSMSASNANGAALTVMGDLPDTDATHMFTIMTTLTCMYTGGDATRVCTTEFTSTRVGGVFSAPASGGTTCMLTTP